MHSIALLGSLVAVAGTASASPLAEAWRVPNGCRGNIVRTATHVFATGDATGLAGYELAHGKRTFADKTATSIYFTGGIDDLVVQETDEEADAFDAKGTHLWHHAGHGAGLTATGVVFVSDAGKRHTLEHVAARTGASLWTTSFTTAEESMQNVVVTLHLVLAITDDTMRAFAAATGKLAWTTKIERSSQVVAVGDDIGVVFDDALHLLDHASGKVVYTSPKFHAMATPIVHGKSVYVTAADESGNWVVQAFHIGAKTLAWTLGLPAWGGVFGATDHAVVVYDAISGVRLVDPATGAVVAHSAFGLADDASIAVGASAPMIVACDANDLVALDPSGTTSTTEETAIVTGILTCGDCQPDVKKIRFRIGQSVGETDNAGRFTATVTGRGRLVVQTDVHGFAPRDLWITPRNDKGSVVGIVTFAGKKSYDLGTIVTRSNNSARAVT